MTRRERIDCALRMTLSELSALDPAELRALIEALDAYDQHYENEKRWQAQRFDRAIAYAKQRFVETNEPCWLTDIGRLTRWRNRCLAGIRHIQRSYRLLRRMVRTALIVGSVENDEG